MTMLKDHLERLKRLAGDRQALEEVIAVIERAGELENVVADREGRVAQLQGFCVEEKQRLDGILADQEEARAAAQKMREEADAYAEAAHTSAEADAAARRAEADAYASKVRVTASAEAKKLQDGAARDSRELLERARTEADEVAKDTATAKVALSSLQQQAEAKREELARIEARLAEIAAMARPVAA